jgi:hypothetical protein
MASDKKSRKKTGHAAVKSSKAKATVKAKTTKPAPKKQAKKKVKRQSKPKLGQQVGAPPADMAPPEIRDSRPLAPGKSPDKVAGADTSNVQTTSTDAAPGTATDSAPASQPQSEPTRATELYGPLVQGATCTWIGRMSQTKDDGHGVPVCPNCGGHLVESTDEDTIRLGVEQYELGAYTSVNPPPRPHPGYTGMVTWMRGQGKCWPTIEAAAESYFKTTGTRVDPSR